jgi:perosamine synthetase
MIPLARPLLGVEEQAAVAGVLSSGQLAAGPEVAAFEAEFAEYVGVAHAVATSNGTTALWLGLWAAGIGPGDEVVVPSFTFAATAGAVRQVGATPVFADIDPHSFCLSAATVRPHLGSRTAAVIAVHLFGQPAPMDELGALCSSHGVALVEDAAQAHGALFDGRPVGGVGAFGAFSFYPTKNLTTGEGGMLTTGDAGLARAARMLRNHGMEERYRHVRPGTNARMTEMAGAIGRVQLRRLPGWNRQRRANAARLDELLAGAVVTPRVLLSTEHVFNQYTIRSPRREALLSGLRDAGIGWGIYYPLGCHRQPAFGEGQEPLPETDWACEQVVSLPVRPDLSDEELAAVAQAVWRGVS